MNIKLKDKDKPISLKEVKVDKIPKSAIELVKEVKKINKKVKKGDK